MDVTLSHFGCAGAYRRLQLSVSESVAAESGAPELVG
jgi:hypothetical protein